MAEICVFKSLPTGIAVLNAHGRCWRGERHEQCGGQHKQHVQLGGRAQKAQNRKSYSLILYLLFRMPMNMKQINKNLADGLGQALDEHVGDKLVVIHVQDTGHLLGVAVSEG